MKKLIAIFSMIFLLSVPQTFAEFDDDICISVGDFHLYFGWFLDYCPQCIDKNETFFPLFNFVEENYEELSKSHIDLFAWIEKSGDENFPFKVKIFDHTIENDNGKSYPLKKEEDCVLLFLKIFSECVKNKNPVKSENLTIYLVAKKIEYENEEDWRSEGELRRHTLSYNMTKDWYLYALYFSKAKAEEKASQYKNAKVLKLVCTKDNISRLDIDWETVLGDIK